jgi:hypothetical protein
MSDPRESASGDNLLAIITALQSASLDPSLKNAFMGYLVAKEHTKQAEANARAEAERTQQALVGERMEHHRLSALRAQSSQARSIISSGGALSVVRSHPLLRTRAQSALFCVEQTSWVTQRPLSHQKSLKRTK